MSMRMSPEQRVQHVHVSHAIPVYVHLWTCTCTCEQHVDNMWHASVSTIWLWMWATYACMYEQNGWWTVCTYIYEQTISVIVCHMSIWQWCMPNSSARARGYHIYATHTHTHTRLHNRPRSCGCHTYIKNKELHVFAIHTWIRIRIHILTYINKSRTLVWPSHIHAKIHTHMHINTGILVARTRDCHAYTYHTHLHAHSGTWKCRRLKSVNVYGWPDNKRRVFAAEMRWV